MAEKSQGKEERLEPRLNWLSGQGPALAVLLVGAVFIVGGLQFTNSAGRFPIMLGATTVVLALLEIIGAAVSKAPTREESEVRRFDKAEVNAVAWIFFTIAAIYVAGILVGALLSTVLFCRFIEKRALSTSIVISGVNVFVIWFAFSYLAKFTLYWGVIF